MGATWIVGLLLVVAASASSVGQTVTADLPLGTNVNKLVSLASPPINPGISDGRVYLGSIAYYVSVPADLLNMEVIQPSFSDRSNDDAAFLQLNLKQRSEIYIVAANATGFRTNITVSPNPGLGWTVQTEHIIVNASAVGGHSSEQFNLYSQIFPTGVITIGGCNCASGFMYQVVVVPRPDSGGTIYGFSYIIAGAVVIGGGVLVLTIIFCCWYRRWARGRRVKAETMKRLAEKDNPQKIIPARDIKLGVPLGEGFSGIVYHSRWHGTEVAAKRMRNQQDTPENRKMFQLETFVHEKLLGHPRVVSYLGACYDPPDLTIVMELYGAGSVEDLLIRDQKFPIHNSLGYKELKTNLDTVVRIMVDASSGLLHCHYSSLIHRDVRAANFLVTIEHGIYRATISDFGLSRFLEKDQTEGIGDDGERLPMLWMAPEAILYNKYSEKSDVYMFGTFLYELFARTRPYTGINMGTVMRMKALQQLNVHPMLPENIPIKLKKMISECWHYDPENRPKMQDLNDILVDFQREVESCPPQDVAKTFKIGEQPIFVEEDVNDYKGATGEGGGANKEDGNYGTYRKAGYIETNKNPEGGTAGKKEPIYDTPYLEMSTTKGLRPSTAAAIYGSAINSSTSSSSSSSSSSPDKKENRSSDVKSIASRFTGGGSPASSGSSSSDDSNNNASLPRMGTTPPPSAGLAATASSSSESADGVSKENISSVSALVNAFSSSSSSDADKTSTLRLTVGKDVHQRQPSSGGTSD